MTPILRKNVSRSFFLCLKRHYFAIIALFIFLMANYTSFASNFVYETFATIRSQKIEYIGSTAGGQLGASLTTGDYNNDGIDDLAVSSPFSSLPSKEWCGSVSVLFGKSDIRYYPVDLFNNPADLVFWGENSGDQLGTSLSTGDYNNDGIDDLAIGAYNALFEDKRIGKVYIFYGKAEWPKNSMEADVELIGDQENGGFGLSLASFDINNDSIDDILVGAPFASTPEISKAGIVYGYLGENSKGISPFFDILLYGQNSGERFGSSISSGNIDKDKKTDVVIGAYYADVNKKTHSGKVYIYNGFGLFSPRGDFASVIFEPISYINGTENNEWFGFAVDVGDLNEDGRDDIAVSSFPFKGEKNSAKVSIYYGKPERYTSRNIVHPLIYKTTADLVIDDPMSESMAGASLLLKDLNSDNKKEIIIGAPGVGNPASTNPGDVYIVYNIKNPNITSTIHGEKPDDWFGYSIGVLDFNGDGYKDLAVGSRYSDSSRAINDGKVFVLFGQNTPYGVKKEAFGIGYQFVTRGKFINIIMDKFDLKNKKADLISKCYTYREFCFFNFLAMSSYEYIQLEPEIILYPDVKPSDIYYEDITIGTMLGLMNGYLSEQSSPFHSEYNISRIQALKVILAAADLVPSKYRFELINELGSAEALENQFSYFADVNPKIFNMWWYPRYVNFAVEKGIVDKTALFRPDEYIMTSELADMIDRTLNYLNSRS